MNVVERSNFLVNRYGDNCMQVIESILQNCDNDKACVDYWNKVKAACVTKLSEIKNNDSL